MVLIYIASPTRQIAPKALIPHRRVACGSYLIARRHEHHRRENSTVRRYTHRTRTPTLTLTRTATPYSAAAPPNRRAHRRAHSRFPATSRGTTRTKHVPDVGVGGGPEGERDSCDLKGRAGDGVEHPGQALELKR